MISLARERLLASCKSLKVWITASWIILVIHHDLLFWQCYTTSFETHTLGLHLCWSISAVLLLANNLLLIHLHLPVQNRTMFALFIKSRRFMPLPWFHIYCSTLILIIHEIVLPLRFNLLELDMGIRCTRDQVSETSFEVFQCLLGGRRVLRLLHESLI